MSRSKIIVYNANCHYAVTMYLLVNHFVIYFCYRSFTNVSSRSGHSSFSSESRGIEAGKKYLHPCGDIAIHACVDF